MESNSRKPKLLGQLDACRAFVRTVLSDGRTGESTRSDVCQEALLEIHRCQASFRGSTSGEERAWIRMIAKRSRAKHMIHRGRQKRTPRRGIVSIDSDANTPLSRADTPEVEAERQERWALLKKALLLHEYEVLELRYVEGMKLKEIATALGRNVNSVKGILKRSLKKARQTLTPGE